MSAENILGRLAADMNELLTEPVGSRRVKITDLTPRDGQQCKLATRVTTDDLLPLCAALDNCGFHAVEVWGGATFDVCMRYLKEDPWDTAAAHQGSDAQDEAPDAAARPTYSRLPALHGQDRLQIRRARHRQRHERVSYFRSDQ